MNKKIKQLSQARDSGAIPEIAFQFSEFIQRMEPECPAEVLLGACLAVVRKGEGDVCIELDKEADTVLFGDKEYSGIQAPTLETWVSALRSSKCVGEEGDHTPLILDSGNRLYLQKYWKYEQEVARTLLDKASMEPETDVDDSDLIESYLNNLFGSVSDGEGTDWQKVAAFTSLYQKLTVISGGPGTGKTSTVVKILVLLAQLNLINHAAMAAPTGKAAARLRESVMSTLEGLNLEEEIREAIPEEAFTIHKLLGAKRQATEFRYNRETPLPYDLVIIDEASMVDLSLMHSLLVALPQKSGLILLGDKDQLASVEAGAVLGSLCFQNQNQFSETFFDKAQKAGLRLPESARMLSPKKMTDHIVLLQKSYRFGSESGIGKLADSILRGDSEQALAVMNERAYPDVTFINEPGPEILKETVFKIANTYLSQLREKTSLEDAIELITEFGILCVHRKGPLGTEQVNRLTEQMLRRQKLISSNTEWYAGKPVIITRNDYSLGLSNGDLGITLKDGNGDLKVFFREDERTYISFFPNRLSNVETAYAMTVHKSQGSEFSNVYIVLPGNPSLISTRELLYTGVTRARNSCTIMGSAKVLEHAISQKANRSSGLKGRIWKDS